MTHSNTRRRFAGALAAAATLGVAPVARRAHAQAGKPLTIVIGFPAGGPLDLHARLLQDRLQAVLGTQVIIDYRAGAGGTVGAQSVAKGPADGSMLLLANTGTMVINPALYPKLPYDTLKDFVPVARSAQQPLALIVHPSVPAGTIQEFVAHARKNPGKLNYGSAGNGGISHLVPEMFKRAAGIYMVHIPYRGSAPAFNDLMGGQVQFMAESVPQAAQYARQGRVRALAVTSRARNAALPEVPTLVEAGYKDMEVVGFYGFLAPAGTPREAVQRLSAALRQVLETPEIRDRMVAQGADPAYLDAEAFARFLTAEMPKWAKVVKESGAKID